jgi:hypothetical protein
MNDPATMTRDELVAQFQARGFVCTGLPGSVYNLRRGDLQANKSHGADELTFLRERLTELQNREADGAQ